MLFIFLCVVLALLTFLMCMAILIQEPKQAGLSGSFGMGGEQMLGAGSPNAISKFTGMLAVVFLVLCLVIGLVDKHSKGDTGIRPQEGDVTGITPAVEPDPGSASEAGGAPADNSGGQSGTEASGGGADNSGSGEPSGGDSGG